MSLAFRSACVSRSDCSGNSTFACANPARCWPMPTQSARRRIKKLRKLALDSGTDLWAMDEVHFQQHGSRCRMWIPPECRDPVLLHAPTRKSVGYWGAVRLRDGLFVHRRETQMV